MPQEPVDLYFWPTPNGLKISIMLEETGLPYRVHFVDIGAGQQFAPEFLKISPNNKMPAIVDQDGPDGNPLAIFESGAILQYLGRKSEMFYPLNERKRADVDQWLFWQVSGLGPMTGQLSHFRKSAPEKIPYAIARYAKEVDRLYGVLDRQLEGKEYLAGGEYTIADIAVFPWVRYGRPLLEDFARFHNIAAWFVRVESRAGVQRGLAVGREEAARTQR